MAFLVVSMDDPGRRVRSSSPMSSATPSPKSPRSSPTAGGMSPTGLLGPPPHPRVAGSRGSDARQARLVRDFKQAWEAKDIDALVGLLDPDATRSPTAAASSAPCSARSKAASRSSATSSGFAGRAPHLTIVERTVNGRPAWWLSRTASP